MAPRPSHIVGQPLRRLGGLPCMRAQAQHSHWGFCQVSWPFTNSARFAIRYCARVQSFSACSRLWRSQIAHRNHLASNVSISFAPQQLLPHRTGRSAVRVPLTARRRSVLTIERL
jgi:hypothetical protein